MGKTASLEDLGIDELLALKDQIETRLAKAVPNEVQQLEERLAKLSKYASAPKSVSRKTAAPKAAPSSKRKSALKGTKAPIKFRDPKSGKAWSGRGMTPVWIREYESKGGKREDFSV